MRPALPVLLRRACEEGNAVRLLGVTVSNLDVPAPEQGELWEMA